MTSLLVDDILDEVHWTNVQDPVKQMFAALTKAVRTQSAGMRDIDRKIGYLISKESAEHLVEDIASRLCTKTEVVEIMRHIDTKSDASFVNGLDAKVSKVGNNLQYKVSSIL